ncbi:MAG: sugar transferase [Clostridium perfringens]|uniref:sugar transferase n=1 Tax=Clostridium perfringens TaxID=1502 RepID=UPI00016BC657|nr:sugar transferase [Clostridium perfringens]EDT28025.1 undecaprenyl-phosphate galactosephosphotransferase [Clostridium perfringens CPE str. F4969]MDB2044162.1 sugar transferase [Clostridium perfringens]MDB2056268.1 sugar transferase [Clostridium perfringens]MDK0574916.1 sugar transferase [Clostridium perfringens]MDM0677642.1 sugar transferase [Clostridium perfringens]
MNRKIQYYIKRIIDLVASFIGVIILFPIFVVVAILVKTKLGSPIFFKQKRIGKNNEEFEMIKFRTMTDEKDKLGNLLPNEERLTKFGKVLRSTSLDEIPELINVLKGDMSLVGPRPLPVRYLPLYSSEQLKRHNVLPGITGWAQVNGRNSITWSEKFALDLWYVENFNIILDFKILFLTVYKVFKRDGINQNDNTVMEAFNGKN